MSIFAKYARPVEIKICNNGALDYMDVRFQFLIYTPHWDNMEYCKRHHTIEVELRGVRRLIFHSIRRRSRANWFQMFANSAGPEALYILRPAKSGLKAL